MYPVTFIGCQLPLILLELVFTSDFLMTRIQWAWFCPILLCVVCPPLPFPELSLVLVSRIGLPL